ncbi:MAG: DUF1883 domain-containing protein [Flavobacteriales bacterium]|nr:DUF1883 domain-containing protein [Flavobacteriales bacterium]
MRYLYKQFQAKKKQVLEVDLDRSTRVKFMTAQEYRRYERARTHTFFGGSFEAGQVRFVVPFDSVWTAVVEKGTHAGPIEVNAACRLLPPDPDVRSTRPLDAPLLAGSHGEDSEVETGE